MANPILSDLEANVAAATTVMGSATTLIDGMVARQEAAIAAALANGATATELEPLTTLNAAFKASSDALAAEVLENTPAADARSKGR